MDTSKMLSLLEALDDEIDDLEEAVSPLLKTTLSETASKLPLLDKAKLYVLVTYAIESILFSYLRLHGIKARQHPVFAELTRVKQYFQKLKVAENPVNNGIGKRENLTLNKGVAQRIITASLSGNDKWDLEHAEQKAKERAKAHIKFTELSEKMKQEELSKKRKAENDAELQVDNGKSTSESESDSGSSVEAIMEAPKLEAPELLSQRQKKRKLGKDMSLDASEPMSAVSSGADDSRKSEKKNRKLKKKTQKSKAGKERKSAALPKSIGLERDPSLGR